jgi:NAD(P)-dependent dehydrogenase (short-subunit alcohol dehydrogenase family)
MGLLESKVIVITGGSLGIGFEIAKKCASEGATVVISARNKDNLQKALNELKKIKENNHQFYSLDVSQYNGVKKFSAWYSEKFNSLYGLVNCAGIYGPIGKTHQINIEKFTEAIKINLLGTVYMCHAFIPLFISNSRKKIINFSGGGASSPFPNYSAYATSKIAIVRFTENISIELSEEGYDINCVAPGFVITRLHQDTIKAGPGLASQSFYDNTKKQIESGGTPAEKAVNLAIFLLSSESDGITGKFISAPWDPWQEKEFLNRLRTDKDFATLRRIDDKTFYKKVSNK